MNKQSKTRFPDKMLIALPHNLRAKITEQAAKIGTTDSEFVRGAIREKLAQN